jgi:hypothetical protein
MSFHSVDLILLGSSQARKTIRAVEEHVADLVVLEPLVEAVVEEKVEDELISSKAKSGESFPSDEDLPARAAEEALDEDLRDAVRLRRTRPANVDQVTLARGPVADENIRDLDALLKDRAVNLRPPRAPTRSSPRPWPA